MNILLIYPESPDTFWSFKHALKFISKKSVNPPLGLMTIASMLPSWWSKKLVDLNVRSLSDAHLNWADMVFISGMSVQRTSIMEIIARCKKTGKKIVAGGPLFTEEPESFSAIDHLVLNEAEITLPLFINDWMDGKPQRIYETTEYANLEQSPVPDYSLINIHDYATLMIQFTRGCPFDCEFCDITALLGRKVRVKSTQQIIDELDNLYQTGWRGSVFFC